ncbi:hypothetical protein Acid345_3166 [Candidatus Koribacter versatilis Ellin345]|uniref:Uncharacterized protein n=1 Tax=Koribacter versatilis (strain Ellin345) TaxID=204669 RepID=Q1ILT3_KORVE|nr:phage tail tube protein [Candidatus Koribacter versatilis]ABF42167.1 hypothetical protein Acid345_3166 [Candidatus Koribacter versatilis Ellin345]
MSTQSTPGYNGLAYASSDGGSTYPKLLELTDVTLSVDTDELDGRSHDSAGAYDPVAGSQKWTADATVLSVDADAGQAALIAAVTGKSTLKFHFDPAGTSSGKPRRAGDGIITSWQEAQPNTALRTTKIKIAGKGALVFSTQ